MPRHYSRLRQKTTDNPLPVEAKILKIVDGGDGLAYVGGKAVFVRGALPGELVEVRVVSRTKSFDRAEVLRVLEPSRDRIAPPCAFYEQCGGCNLQHAAYSRQLSIKQGILLENLERIGRFAPADLPPIRINASQPLGYRGRVRLRATRERTRYRYGFVAHRTNVVIPIEQCCVAHPAVNAVMKELAADGSGGTQSLTDADPQRAPHECLTIVAGIDRVYRSDRDREAVVRFAGRPFRFAINSFVQANLAVAERVAERLRAWLEMDVFVDLYGGAGLFAAGMAGDALAGMAGDALAGTNVGDRLLAEEAADSQVHNIEDGAAIPHIKREHIKREHIKREHIKREHIDVKRMVCVEPDADNATYVRANVGEHTVGMAAPTVDLHVTTAEQAVHNVLDTRDMCVFVDPPRTGLSPTVRTALAELLPRQLAYLSCDAAALARDLSMLRNAFRIESIEIFDFFPQTAHIETLVLLRS